MKQYGIRLRTVEDLSWSEFCSLLSGFMKDTPLATVVAIRAETDCKVIENFTKEQRKIRNDWNKKHKKGKGLADLENMQQQLKSLFGSSVKKGG